MTIGALEKRRANCRGLPDDLPGKTQQASRTCSLLQAAGDPQSL
jgi:hypothetical protein